MGISVIMISIPKKQKLFYLTARSDFILLLYVYGTKGVLDKVTLKTIVGLLFLFPHCEQWVGR